MKQKKPISDAVVLKEITRVNQKINQARNERLDYLSLMVNPVHYVYESVIDAVCFKLARYLTGNNLQYKDIRLHHEELLEALIGESYETIHTNKKQ